MREWIRRLCARAAKFTMLRSVWFANLDCMVNIVQYLQDDDRQYKQCGKSCQSDKPFESEQCCESASHTCTNHSARTCNCTGHDCIDNDSNRNTSYFGSHGTKYYDDIGYRGKVSDVFNQHLYEFNELHNQLAGKERCTESTRSTKE